MTSAVTSDVGSCISFQQSRLLIGNGWRCAERCDDCPLGTELRQLQREVRHLKVTCLGCLRYGCKVAQSSPRGGWYQRWEENRLKLVVATSLGFPATIIDGTCFDLWQPADCRFCLSTHVEQWDNAVQRNRFAQIRTLSDFVIRINRLPRPYRPWSTLVYCRAMCWPKMEWSVLIFA